MKTFNRQAAQGDLLITRIDNIPKGLRLIKMESDGGKFILAHSETGHHHSIQEVPGVTFYQDPSDPLIAYLQVIDNVGVVLEHERDFDTHESYLIKGGTYEVRRQREHVPGGFRQVED
jgi:hypothetical protein